MNFDDFLLKGIPQAEAAAFFIQVRGVEKQATVADLDAAFESLSVQEQYALLKQAEAMGMGAPMTLPPTAQGQNMQAAPPVSLPPAAQGQHAVPPAKTAASKSPEETGHERARASLSAEFAKEHAHRSERHGELAGRGAGAAAGAALMHHYGKGNPMATLGGAWLGQHMGGKAGREVGGSMDRHRHEKTANDQLRQLVDSYATMHNGQPLDRDIARRNAFLMHVVSPNEVAAHQAANREAVPTYRQNVRGGQLLGALGGAAGGSLLAHLAKKPLSHGAFGGALAGATLGTLGGAVRGGKRYAQEHARVLARERAARGIAAHIDAQQSTPSVIHFNQTGALPEEWKTAAAYQKAASAFKFALDEMGMQPEQEAAPQPMPGAPIEPMLAPEVQQYLALQQQAQQGAENNHIDFLRQKLQQAQQAQEQQQQEAQQLQQQVQQAQQQQALNEQQTAAYQAQVASSTQKAMAAQDQILQQQQAAAAMRMAYQQLRGTLLQAASQEPPSLTGMDAAAQAASQAAAPSSAPEPTSGPAGQAASPGAAPNSVAPMGEDQNNAPAAGTEPMFANANPATSMNQKDQQGQTPGKEVLSHFLPFGVAGKQASLKNYLTMQAGKAVSVLPHAAAGAAMGGGLGYLESRADYDPLRQKVQELEAKPDRGYRDALNLAQSRARLTMGEFANEHPGVSAGMGALGGALLGASNGPQVVGSLKRSGEHVGSIARNLKDILSKRAG